MVAHRLEVETVHIEVEYELADICQPLDEVLSLLIEALTIL